MSKTYWKCIYCPKLINDFYSPNKIYIFNNKKFTSNYGNVTQYNPLIFNSLGQNYPKFLDVTKKYSTKLGKIFYGEKES